MVALAQWLLVCVVGVTVGVRRSHSRPAPPQPRDPPVVRTAPGVVATEPKSGWIPMTDDGKPIIFDNPAPYGGFDQLTANALQFLNFSIDLPYRKYASGVTMCEMRIRNLLFEAGSVEKGEVRDDGLHIIGLQTIATMDLFVRLKVMALSPCAGTSGSLRVLVKGDVVMGIDGSHGSGQCVFDNFEVSILDGALGFPMSTVRLAAKHLGLVPEIAEHAFETVCHMLRDPYNLKFAKGGVVIPPEIEDEMVSAEATTFHIIVLVVLAIFGVWGGCYACIRLDRYRLGYGPPTKPEAAVFTSSRPSQAPRSIAGSIAGARSTMRSEPPSDDDPGTFGMPIQHLRSEPAYAQRASRWAPGAMGSTPSMPVRSRVETDFPQHWGQPQ